MEPNPAMSPPSEKREFERLPFDLNLKVSAKDIHGKRFRDAGVLNDVSGEGAKFSTQNIEQYYPGQMLAVSIVLPGIDHVSAHMKTKASVTRIEPGDETGNASTVAVRFKTHLTFERFENR